MCLPEIGAKIKQLRTQKKLSQIALAKRLGVSKSVISSYENGIHLPPYDILLQMARIFGVSTDYLLGASSNCAVDADGLTSSQVEAVVRIVEEFRSANRRY